MYGIDITTFARWNTVSHTNVLTMWINIDPTNNQRFFLVDGRSSGDGNGGYIQILENGLVSSANYINLTTKVNDEPLVGAVPKGVDIKIEFTFTGSATTYLHRFFSQNISTERRYFSGSIYAIKWICGGDSNKNSLWRFSPLFMSTGEGVPTRLLNLTGSKNNHITLTTHDSFRDPWVKNPYLKNQRLSSDLGYWNNDDSWWNITDNMAFHPATSEQKNLFQPFVKAPLAGTTVRFDYKWVSGTPRVFCTNEAGSDVGMPELILPTTSGEQTVDFVLTTDNCHNLSFSRSGTDSTSFSVSNIRFIDP